MKSYFFAACLLSLSQSAFSQILSDQGLSPLEKKIAGQKLNGIYKATNTLYCSQKSIQQKIGFGLYSENAQVADPLHHKKNLLIKDLNQDLYTSLSQAYQYLLSQNDQTAKQNHLCVGYYNYAELNAQSYLHGYIFVDPSVLFTMRDLPNRSMLSSDMTFLHELAHQFQYWHGNAFNHDKTVKRLELAADCTGAALLYLVKQRQWGDATMKISEQGLRAATERVGDFNFHHKSHHGTPQERMFATDKGISWAKQQVQLQKNWKLELTSKSILSYCENMVKVNFK